MKTSEIKELTVAEIREKLEVAKADLNRLKLTHTVSPVENPGVIRRSRRDIARMLTLLHQRETETLNQ